MSTSRLPVTRTVGHVQVVDPSSSPLWEGFVRSQPSSVFHSPAWMGVLGATHRLDVNALLVLDETGAPVAGMPFAHVEDLRGERIVCLPFSDHCDPLAEDRAAWDALVDVLGEWGCPVTVRTLRSDVVRSDERFPAGKRAKWHGLGLQRELDDIWRGLAGNARSRIRQAWKGGVTVRAAHSEGDLRRFFDMLLRLRKHKYGLLCQPFSFFVDIWERFIEPGDGVLLLAEENGTVVAGTLYLVWKDTLYYKYNASVPGGLASRPNDLLIWEGVRYGTSRALALLDFGLSDIDQEGLVRYKRKYADDERDLWFQRWVPDPRRAGAARDGPQALEEAVRLLTRDDVPDAVTEQAGAAFYRYFA